MWTLYLSVSVSVGLRRRTRVYGCRRDGERSVHIYLDGLLVLPADAQLPIYVSPALFLLCGPALLLYKSADEQVV